MYVYGMCMCMCLCMRVCVCVCVSVLMICDLFICVYIYLSLVGLFFIRCIVNCSEKRVSSIFFTKQSSYNSHTR